MTVIFSNGPLFSAFLFASFILAVTPGPGVVYIVTRSVVQGRRYGLASVGGVALGNFCNAVGASLGLAAVFAVSSLAFSVIKFVGALYLIYLGFGLLRSTPADHSVTLPDEARLLNVFRDGFIVALLNPKTMVFFAAFLPQFLNARESTILQSIALGSLFVAIAAVTDSVYAFAASTVAPALRRNNVGQMGRRIGGGIFIGLGLFAAFSDMRGDK